MSTWQTELSLHSETSAIFDSISQKSQNEFLFKLESAQIDEKIQLAVWESFGSYIRKQMKQGKSVQIPRFGKFTFTFHSANPNASIDDFNKISDQRKPIFIISKDFIGGKDIKAGIFTESGMTPYPHLSQTGKVQEGPLNLVEIGMEANTTKDIAKLCLQRVFREILSIVKNIPIFRGFSRGRNLIPLSPVLQGRPYSSFRADNPSDMSPKPMYVDEGASEYLKKELDIDVVSLNYGVSPKRQLKRPFQNLESLIKLEAAQPQNRAASFSVSLSHRPENNNLINRILLWIRNQRMSPTDAFYSLVSEVHGIEGTSESKLSFEDFGKVLKKLDLKLSTGNARNLFNVLDKNKDGFIDINDWISITAREEAPAKVLNTILKNSSFGPSKILEALGLKKECSFVDRKMLYEGISKLDPSLQPGAVSDLVEKMLEGKDFMDVDRLVDILQLQQDSEMKDYETMKNLIEKVRSFLYQNQKQQILAQKLKESSQGNDTVFVRDFKYTLNKVGLKLTDTEMNKLARRYELGGGKLVEFKKFLKEVETVDEASELSLRKVAEKLQNYIKAKKWETQFFLRKVSGLSEIQTCGSPKRNNDDNMNSLNKVPISVFGLFLKNNIIDKANEIESDQVADRIDIDRDGYISKEDLETFMSRSFLYPKNENLQNELATSRKLSLFPKESLGEKDVENFLRELRGVLDLRRMTNHELFSLLDSNEDGFLTINEFCTGLEKIIPIPRIIFEGFFAYIDRYKVGCIDLQSFLKVMKKSIYVKETVVVEDNFNWPVEMIKKMRNYFQSRDIERNDAFRVVDLDFDGNISKNDLKLFLLKSINIPPEEITDPRIDRLFKLLDGFKRGCILLDDFLRIFDDKVQFSTQKSIETKELSTSYSQPNLGLDTTNPLNPVFEWMMNAKQQIGLVISQKFESLRASFDIISAHTSKILYKTFRSWIEDNNILQGFNLTANLLLQFFASLDPHKKGYLTFNDWELAFKNYDWNSQLLTEFKNVLYSNFSTVYSAFSHFCPGKDKPMSQYYSDTKPEFGFSEFSERLKSLAPKRYSAGEIEFIWNKITFGREKMNFSQFAQMLDPKKFEGADASPSQYTMAEGSDTQTFNDPWRRTQTSSVRKGRISRNSCGGQFFSVRGACSMDTFEKLKRNIRSAKTSALELFQEVDQAKKGKISSIEFKNVLMKLNIGLSSTDIGYLMDFANVEKDGSIDWKSFLNRILLRESEVQLFKRYKEKLAKMKENIYKFMLTPKDAFTRYNNNGTGRLMYEEFVQFVNHLHKYANEEIPSLAVTKDLFNFVDIKKDGYIDINEWNQTFNQLSAYYGKEEIQDPKKQAMSLSKTLVEFNKVDWVNSKNYDDVMAVIGRNRKLLDNKFLDLEQRKVAITFDIAKNVIKDVLDHAGVSIEDKNWNILFKFAETKGLVDFRKLLSVFKDRFQKTSSIPRAKLLYI